MRPIESMMIVLADLASRLGTACRWVAPRRRRGFRKVYLLAPAALLSTASFCDDLQAATQHIPCCRSLVATAAQFVLSAETELTRCLIHSVPQEPQDVPAPSETQGATVNHQIKASVTVAIDQSPAAVDPIPTDPASQSTGANDDSELWAEDPALVNPLDDIDSKLDRIEQAARQAADQVARLEKVAEQLKRNAEQAAYLSARRATEQVSELVERTANDVVAQIKLAQEGGPTAEPTGIAKLVIDKLRLDADWPAAARPTTDLTTIDPLTTSSTDTNSTDTNSTDTKFPDESYVELRDGTRAERPDWTYYDLEDCIEHRCIVVRVGPSATWELVDAHTPTDLVEQVGTYARFSLAAQGSADAMRVDARAIRAPIRAIRKHIAQQLDCLHVSRSPLLDPMPMRFILIKFDDPFVRKYLEPAVQMAISEKRAMHAAFAWVGLLAAVGTSYGTLKLVSLTRAGKAPAHPPLSS